MAVSDPCPECNGAGEIYDDLFDEYISCDDCLSCGVIIGKDHGGMEQGYTFKLHHDHDNIWRRTISKLLRDHPEWFKFPTSIVPAIRFDDDDDDDDERKPYGRI